MKTKWIILLGITHILVLAGGAWGLHFYNDIIAERDSKKKKAENTIVRSYYSDLYKVADYSGVKYKLEDGSLDLIQNIRSLHTSPSFIDQAYADNEVCAGYIWTLSEKLWGENIPYYIGMMDQERRQPSSAWELPDSYRAFGGKILIDFSEKFDLKTKDYWDKISLSEVQKFFEFAFQEKSLFGDFGFLYTKTKHINKLLKERSYNSHIVKNMGLSKYEFVVGDPGNKSHEVIMRETLGCDESIFSDLKEILKNYKLILNGKMITFDENEFYYIKNNVRQEKVAFHYLDKIEYQDITLAHYFEKKSHVDSLFQFVCQGKFYPVNITTINARLVEKM